MVFVLENLPSSSLTATATVRNTSVCLPEHRKIRKHFWNQVFKSFKLQTQKCQLSSKAPIFKKRSKNACQILFKKSFPNRPTPKQTLIVKLPSKIGNGVGFFFGKPYNFFLQRIIKYPVFLLVSNRIFLPSILIFSTSWLFDQGLKKFPEHTN